MNARTLIDQYNQTVQEEKQLEQQRKTEIFQRGMEQFKLNCAGWLGELVTEFQIGDPTFRESTNWNSNDVRFNLPVSFMGIPGDIEQRLNVQTSQWDVAKLDFGTLHFSRDSYFSASLNLYLGADNEAISPNPRDMGHLLAKLEQYLPIKQENERKYNEIRKQDLLNFQHYTVPGISAKLREAIKEFPEMADQFKAAAEAALREEEETERRRDEENRHYQEIAQEREKLQGVAARAWDMPFTLYLVTYGAYVDDGSEDGDVLTRTFYSVDEGPQEDGYWYALENGKTTRQIKPNHVMSIERIEVTSEAECPYDAKRHVELKSKTVEDASAYVNLPPVDVFAFDIESMSQEA
jgi:hypothetical protein